MYWFLKPYLFWVELQIPSTNFCLPYFFVAQIQPHIVSLMCGYSIKLFYHPMLGKNHHCKGCKWIFITLGNETLKVYNAYDQKLKKEKTFFGAVIPH